MKTLYEVGTQLGFWETQFLTKVLGTEDTDNELMYRCMGPFGTILLSVEYVHSMINQNRCRVAMPDENPEWLIEWREKEMRVHTRKPFSRLRFVPIFISSVVALSLLMIVIAMIENFLTRDFLMSILYLYLALIVFGSVYILEGRFKKKA